MSLPESTGYLDYGLGYVVPLPSAPLNEMKWVTELIDVGSITDFNLLVNATYEGDISYEIYTSNTGLFEGEESMVAISEGQTNLSSFRCRYLHVVAIVTRTGGLNLLRSIRITVQRKSFDIVLSDIDTSALPGDRMARTLSIGRDVSKVLAMNILARDVRENGYFVNDYMAIGYVGDYGDGYVAAGYWADEYTLTAYIPMVTPFQVSKDRSGPAICLRNEYGEYLDGELDVVITVLPEQYMSNGQLLTR